MGDFTNQNGHPVHTIMIILFQCYQVLHAALAVLLPAPRRRGPLCLRARRHRQEHRGRPQAGQGERLRLPHGQGALLRREEAEEVAVKVQGAVEGAKVEVERAVQGRNSRHFREAPKPYPNTVLGYETCLNF